MTDPSPPKRKPVSRAVLIVVGLIVVASAALIWTSRTATPPDPDHDTTSIDLGSQRFLVDTLLRRGDIEGAVDAMRPMLDADSNPAVHVQFAQLLIASHRYDEAETVLRALLERAPDNVSAHHTLGDLLTREGRRWESRSHLFEVVKQTNDYGTLHFLGNYEDASPLDEEQITNSVANGTEEPLPLIGVARMAAVTGMSDRAETLLGDVLKARPKSVEAHVRLCELLEQRSDPRFAEIDGQFGNGADSHPQMWVVRGRWQESQGNNPEAIRCYLEALKLDPNRGSATQPLPRLLQHEHPNAATELETRSRHLTALYRQLELLFVEDPTVESYSAISRVCESLGRLWEARCWAQHVLQLDTNNATALQTIARLDQVVSSQSPQTVVATDQQFAGLDVSQFPLPARVSNPTRIADANDNTETGDARYQFSDEASARGIDFTFFKGRPFDDGPRMYELMGGGIGVVDFDCDGWPDLALPQGNDRPRQPGSTHTDRLYQNRASQFVDVSAQAGFGDDEYSHGVAIGDFNNDGFPDIYVGNNGANRLYRNNGDGTFEDVTESIPVNANAWTSSVVIVDLNADGLPDLYDANYLASESLTRFCTGNCNPGDFDHEQDRLLLNSGDGSFTDVTESSGLLGAYGKGLGLLAADFTGTNKLDLFVANDSNENFFFERTSPSGSPPQLTNLALTAGVAGNGKGLLEACMGIASTDLDQNGLLDFYVTNFEKETNTLYMQIEPHVFDDRTRYAGLHDPSMWVLGFGTEFFDLENDGDRDLVITNGHVVNMEPDGPPYEMKPQLMQNNGGRFVELKDIAGGFFQQELVGRGLVQLDWNRDGLDDVAVSHIESPFALLNNQTQPAGNFLAVRLVATTTARDAIGTIVTVKAGDFTWSEQLVAGDGYQSTNQRQLLFGLGKATKIDSLTVKWPSGEEQTFAVASANTEYTAIEGGPLLRLP